MLSELFWAAIAQTVTQWLGVVWILHRDRTIQNHQPQFYKSQVNIQPERKDNKQYGPESKTINQPYFCCVGEQFTVLWWNSRIVLKRWTSWLTKIKKTKVEALSIVVAFFWKFLLKIKSFTIVVEHCLVIIFHLI